MGTAAAGSTRSHPRRLFKGQQMHLQRMRLFGAVALMALDVGRRFEHEHTPSVRERDEAERTRVRETADAERAAAEARVRAEVERHIAAAKPDANAGWRTMLPTVEAAVEARGGARSDLSRQEQRAMKRCIAKSEVTVAREAARREVKVQRKRRRAGLGPA